MASPLAMHAQLQGLHLPLSVTVFRMAYVRLPRIWVPLRQYVTDYAAPLSNYRVP